MNVCKLKHAMREADRWFDVRSGELDAALSDGKAAT